MNQFSTIDPNRLSIRFVGITNLSTQLFANSIQETFKSACLVISFHQALNRLTDSLHQLLIVDANQIALRDIEQLIKKLSYENSKTKVVLLNVKRADEFIHLANWPVVYGLIHEAMDLDKVLLALKQIILGELWLPRSILSKYFRSNRKIPDFEEQGSEELTPRENQILGMVAEGFTNPEIADQLSVSTNTIKTHLQNLFKKLSVRNRIQAIDWMKSHGNYEC